MEGPPGGIGQKIPGDRRRGITPFGIYRASGMSAATSNALVLVRSLSLYHMVTLILCGLSVYCHWQCLNSGKVFVSLPYGSFAFVRLVCLLLLAVP